MPRANDGDTTTITIPEELAKEAVFKLLEEIYKVREKDQENVRIIVNIQAGVVDSFGQTLTMNYMALNQTDVSKVITGPLNSYT